MAHYLVRAEIAPQQLEALERELEKRAFVDLRPFGSSLTRGLEGARWRLEPNSGVASALSRAPWRVLSSRTGSPRQPDYPPDASP